MPNDPNPSETPNEAARGADNRGAPATVAANGEVHGSGAGAGGGGAREDQDTDAPTVATPPVTPADDQPERGGDGRKHGSA